MDSNKDLTFIRNIGRGFISVGILLLMIDGFFIFFTRIAPPDPSLQAPFSMYLLSGLLFLGLILIVMGLGLLKRAPWARTAFLVISIAAILFCSATALGSAVWSVFWPGDKNEPKLVLGIFVAILAVFYVWAILYLIKMLKRFQSPQIKVLFEEVPHPVPTADGYDWKREIFGSTPIKYRLDLPSEAVLAKIEENLQDKSFISLIPAFFSSKDFAGKIKGNRVRIRRQHVFFHNSFAPILYGTVTANGQGCVLEGTFKLHPFVKIFMVFWVGFLLFIFSLSQFFPGESAQAHGTVQESSIFLFMMLMGIMLVFGGRLIGKQDEKSVREFLDQLFQGVIISEARQ